jgi:hypothetical protein
LTDEDIEDALMKEEQKLTTKEEDIVALYWACMRIQHSLLRDIENG